MAMLSPWSAELQELSCSAITVVGGASRFPWYEHWPGELSILAGTARFLWITFLNSRFSMSGNCKDVSTAQTCMAVLRCTSQGLRHIAGYSLELIRQASWELRCRVYPTVADSFQCRLLGLLHAETACELLWQAVGGAGAGSFGENYPQRQCRELENSYPATPLPTATGDLMKNATDN